MSNEVMKKNETMMTVGDRIQSSMEAIGVSAEDIQVPRIHLMQNTSEAVGDKKCQLGDLFNLQTLEVVGGVDDPLEIIPLKVFKNWRVMDMAAKPPKFKRIDPFIPGEKKSNEEIDSDGSPIRNDFVLNFYALTLQDVTKGEAFPVLISFTRTSRRGGEQIATQMFTNAAIGLKPYAKVAKVIVSTQKKEKNTFAVISSAKGRDLTKEELAVADIWFSFAATRDSSKATKDVEASFEKEATIVKPGKVSSPTVMVGGEDDIDL